MARLTKSAREDYEAQGVEAMSEHLGWLSALLTDKNAISHFRKRNPNLLGGYRKDRIKISEWLKEKEEQGVTPTGSSFNKGYELYGVSHAPLYADSADRSMKNRKAAIARSLRSSAPRFR